MVLQVLITLKHIRLLGDNMKFGIIKFLAVTALLTCSCAHKLDNKEQDKNLNTADRINERICQSLAKDNFYVFLVGGSSCPSLSLVSYGFATREYRIKSTTEARNLICAIMNKFLKAYNSQKNIRPYLSNYPFESKNFNISLVFLNENNEMLEEPYISEVVCKNGRVTYITRDGYGENRLIAEETFDAANQIYQQRNQVHNDK